MTSFYLLQPLRTELQARIERAVRKVMDKYPTHTWFAKHEGKPSDFAFLAEATQLELEYEEPLLCEACRCHDAEEGDTLCADCRADQEATEDREREYWQEYRGPRYWRSL